MNTKRHTDELRARTAVLSGRKAHFAAAAPNLGRAARPAAAGHDRPTRQRSSRCEPTLSEPSSATSGPKVQFQKCSEGFLGISRHNTGKILIP